MSVVQPNNPNFRLPINTHESAYFTTDTEQVHIFPKIKIINRLYTIPESVENENSGSFSSEIIRLAIATSKATPANQNISALPRYDAQTVQDDRSSASDSSFDTTFDTNNDFSSITTQPSRSHWRLGLDSDHKHESLKQAYSRPRQEEKVYANENTHAFEFDANKIQQAYEQQRRDEESCIDPCIKFVANYFFCGACSASPEETFELRDNLRQKAIYKDGVRLPKLGTPSFALAEYMATPEFNYFLNLNPNDPKQRAQITQMSDSIIARVFPVETHIETQKHIFFNKTERDKVRLAANQILASFGFTTDLDLTSGWVWTAPWFDDSHPLFAPQWNPEKIKLANFIRGMYQATLDYQALELKLFMGKLGEIYEFNAASTAGFAHAHKKIDEREQEIENAFQRPVLCMRVEGLKAPLGVCDPRAMFKDPEGSADQASFYSKDEQDEYLKPKQHAYETELAAELN